LNLSAAPAGGCSPVAGPASGGAGLSAAMAFPRLLFPACSAPPGSRGPFSLQSLPPGKEQAHSLEDLRL